MQSNDSKTPQVRPDISAPQPISSLQSNNDVPGLPSSMTVPSLKPKRKIPIVPIAVAVFVCLMLIGAVIFIYATNQKTPAKVGNDSSQGQVDEGKVSPSDIDAVSKKINDSLNSLNDSTDFKNDDLSDDSLGL